MKIGPGTIAVVTGAASGIGRAVALELLKHGATVAMMDRDAQGLESFSKGMNIDPSRISMHACDISDLREVEVSASAIGETHGRIHLLTNAAGISVAGRIEQIPIERFRAAMEVNFWGMVYVTRALIPLLKAGALEEGRAAIANVLSPFALFSLATKAAYAASKHAARAFTEALAAELQDEGIHVCAAYPGATATAIAANGFAVDSTKQRLEAEMLAKGMRSEAVAAAIIRAVRKERHRVLIGRDTYGIDAASRISPGALQSALRRFWRRIPYL